MAAVPYIIHRGRRMTPDFRDATLAAEQRAGFRFRWTQGGFNAGGVLASAGTHDGDGGDWSIYVDGDGNPMGLTKVALMIEALRWAGIAAWLRTTSSSLWGVRGQGFGSAHVHGVPNGWGSPSLGARRQVNYTDSGGVQHGYQNGRDGLSRNMADVGPGHVSAYRTRTTPGKPSAAGLPSSGGTGTVTPTKEDTLSAAEINELKAHFDKKLRDLQISGLDRSGFSPIGEDAAVRTKSWPITRNGAAVEWIQDSANTGTAVNKLTGQVAGLMSALEALKDGKPVDLTGVAEAARAGAHTGAMEGGTNIADLLQQVVSDALTDLARELSEEDVKRIAAFVRTDLAARLTEGDSK